MTYSKKCNGFTLIEMSVVAVIFSVMVLSVGTGYKLYQKKVTKIETIEHLDDVRKGIREFRSLTWRYPCPANPELPSTHVNFGLEDCRNDIPLNTFTTAGGVLSVANLEPHSDGITGIRDIDNDGIAETVLIGAIPFRTINAKILEGISDHEIGRTKNQIELKEILDGWDRQYTYAVTKRLTRTATYNTEHGVIGVFDENRRSVVEPENSAHMLLISHGKNGMGAYNLNGEMIGDCDVLMVQDVDDENGDGDTEDLVEAKPNERENCDKDGAFVLGIKSQDDRQPNDDYVRFYITQDVTLWDQVGNDKITNSNEGAVGVGIRNPAAKFHINGEQRYDEDGNALPVTGLKAQTIKTPEICTIADDCLEPNLIGGGIIINSGSCPAGQKSQNLSGGKKLCINNFRGADEDGNDEDGNEKLTDDMTCPSGMAIKGISEGKVICTLVEFDIDERTCDEGTFLQGISNTEGLICVDPFDN